MNPSTLPESLASAARDAEPPAQSARAVDLWCNFVAGGWSPYDLDEGLGGSEECLVLWAESLAERGHQVRIFHNSSRPGEETTRRGVTYLPHVRFNPYQARDVLVTWKSVHPWSMGARATRCIHWSSDVEQPWPAKMLNRIDVFLTLTSFHREAMPWLESSKALVIPHGIDLSHLDRLQRQTVPQRAIYASSPDRGLLTLLRDWPRIRLHRPGITLDVFYGWRQFRLCNFQNPQAVAFREGIERLMGQEGIRFRGQVSREELAAAYWEAEYWLHPLNRAESELFCLNAVKAAYCGAKSVGNRIGALQDTVTQWIAYDEFIEGGETIHDSATFPVMDWRTVVARYWEPIFQGR